jgi:hypothetical protein
MPIIDIHTIHTIHSPPVNHTNEIIDVNAAILSKMNSNLISMCESGDIDELNKWYRSPLSLIALKSNATLMPSNILTERNHAKCLEWWLTRADVLPNKCRLALTKLATFSGHIDVLRIWAEFSLKPQCKVEFQFDPSCLSECRNDSMIYFWLEHLMKTKADPYLLINANDNKVQILDVWYNNYTRFGHYYVESCLIDYFTNSHDLKWLLSHQKELNLPYSDMSLWNCGVEQLDIWKSSGLEMKYDSYVLIKAAHRDDYDVLDWWGAQKVSFNFDESLYELSQLIDTADTTLLSHWIQNDWLFVYSEYAISYAIKFGYFHRIKWWCDSGLELKYSPTSIETMNLYAYFKPKIENKKKTFTNGGECSICLESLSDNPSKKIHCGHLFHTKCIDMCWQMSDDNKRCPYCRTPCTEDINNPSGKFANHGELIDYIRSNEDFADKIKFTYQFTYQSDFNMLAPYNFPFALEAIDHQPSGTLNYPSTNYFSTSHISIGNINHSMSNGFINSTSNDISIGNINHSMSNDFINSTSNYNPSMIMEGVYNMLFTG